MRKACTITGITVALVVFALLAANQLMAFMAQSQLFGHMKEKVVATRDGYQFKVTFDPVTGCYGAPASCKAPDQTDWTNCAELPLQETIRMHRGAKPVENLAIAGEPCADIVVSTVGGPIYCSRDTCFYWVP